MQAQPSSSPAAMPSDETLYAAWAAGDIESGERLVDRYLVRMSRFFANKVAERADLDDLVGETFQICAANLGGFRRDGSFRSYLYGIAKNVLRQHVRQRVRGRGDPDLSVTAIRDLGPSQSTMFGQRREHRLLLEGLQAIPVELQMILELAYFEEMTRAQIAELLDMPPGSVATKMSRARRLLAVRMEEIADSPELLRSTIGGIDTWARELRAKITAESDG